MFLDVSDQNARRCQAQRDPVAQRDLECAVHVRLTMNTTLFVPTRNYLFIFFNFFLASFGFSHTWLRWIQLSKHDLS